MLSIMKTSYKTQVGVLTALVAALAVSNVNAAYDAFLKIEGVEGESTRDGHEGEIEILSFSWGVSNPGAIETIGGGSGAGKVTLSDFTVAKRSDKASPKLFRAAVREDIFEEADGHAPIRLVMIYTPEGTEESVEVFSIELDNSVISELRSTVVPAARGGDDEPTESLSFAYGKVTMNASGRNGDTYHPLRAEDAVSADNPALED